MNLHYYPGKDIVVDDSLSRMSMGSTTHDKDEKKELEKEVHILARLGVQFVDSTSWGVSVHPSSESSFVLKLRRVNILILC